MTLAEVHSAIGEVFGTSDFVTTLQEGGEIVAQVGTMRVYYYADEPDPWGLSSAEVAYGIRAPTLGEALDRLRKRLSQAESMFKASLRRVQLLQEELAALPR